MQMDSEHLQIDSFDALRSQRRLRVWMMRVLGFFFFAVSWKSGCLGVQKDRSHSTQHEWPSQGMAGSGISLADPWDGCDGCRAGLGLLVPS